MATLQEMIDDGTIDATELSTYVEASTTGLKTNQQKILQEKTELQKQLDTVNQMGGMDKFKEYVEGEKQLAVEKADTERKAAEASGNIEALNDAHTRQVSSLNDTIDGLKSQMVEDHITASVAKAIGSHNGISELLEPVVKNRIKGSLTETGVDIQVLNSDGTVMMTAEGTNAGVNDLVKSLKENESFGVAFNGSGKTGSGSTQSGAVNTSTKVEMNPRAKGFNMTKAMEHAVANPDIALSQAQDAGVKV